MNRIEYQTNNTFQDCSDKNSPKHHESGEFCHTEEKDQDGDDAKDDKITKEYGYDDRSKTFLFAKTELVGKMRNNHPDDNKHTVGDQVKFSYIL